MNNELTVFQNDVFGKVRTMMVDDEPWFSAKDVCDCLGLGNTTRACAGLYNDEKFTTFTESKGKANYNVHHDLVTVRLFRTKAIKKTPSLSGWGIFLLFSL